MGIVCKNICENVENIHSNHKRIYEEKPMGAVSVFTTGNYHCKPLMTDVTVIHRPMLLSFVK